MLKRSLCSLLLNQVVLKCKGLYAELLAYKVHFASCGLARISTHHRPKLLCIQFGQYLNSQSSKTNVVLIPIII